MAKEVKAKNYIKLKLDELISWNALSNFGPVAGSTLMSSYLLLFYTDICGMNATAVATLFLITRFIDAINDPISGWLIDKIPKSKSNILKTVLGVGGLIYALNFVLVWFGPMMLESGKLLIAYISYILIGITYDVVGTPRGILVNMQTDDIKQRGTAASVNAFATILGGALIAMIFPFVLSAVGEGNAKSAYIYLVIGIAISTTVLLANGVRALKVRVKLPEEVSNYKIKDMLKIFTIWPVVSIIIVTFLNTVTVSITYSTIVYYAKYVLKDEAGAGVVNTFSGLGVIPWLFIGALIARKFGKKNVWAVGLLISAVGFLLRYLDPYNVMWIGICSAISGIGTGAGTIIGPIISADNNELIEYKLGFRADGIIAQINNTSVKMGGALAGAIPGYILGAVGYNSALAAQGKYIPTSGAISGIMFMTNAIPAIFLFAAFLLLVFGYKMNNKQYEEVLKTVRERREAAVPS